MSQWASFKPGRFEARKAKGAIRNSLTALMLGLWLPGLGGLPVWAQETDEEQGTDLQVWVASRFIDLYRGPGRGYPIFHVVEEGEPITLIKRRTDWVKIKTRRGKTGWIRVADLPETHTPDGQSVAVEQAGRGDFQNRRWELGFAFGDFDGADSLTLNLGYHFTPNLTLDLQASQNLGSFSDSQLYSAGLLHQPFPEWRLSPFVRLGIGHIDIEPSATLVEAEDRQDPVFQASVGGYVYLTRRFFLRLEWVNHQILTSRDTNEEVTEWKLGFNVFF